MEKNNNQNAISFAEIKNIAAQVYDETGDNGFDKAMDYVLNDKDWENAFIPTLYVDFDGWYVQAIVEPTGVKIGISDEEFDDNPTEFEPIQGYWTEQSVKEIAQAYINQHDMKQRYHMTEDDAVLALKTSGMWYDFAEDREEMLDLLLSIA